jgi:hypothetical protein
MNNPSTADFVAKALVGLDFSRCNIHINMPPSKNPYAALSTTKLAGCPALFTE